ncbi:MAG: DUF2130 domain-containing protein [Archaeoglobaceae archaeon]
MDEFITCPNCQFRIPVDKVLMLPFVEEERRKLKEEYEKKIKSAVQDAETKLKLLEEELNEKQKQIEKVKKLELELIKKEREMEEQRKAFELEVEKRVENERRKLERELSLKIEEDLKRQIEEIKKKSEEEALRKVKILEEELKEKDKKLEEALKIELELRKKQREIEEQKKALELEVERRLDEEKRKMEKHLKETLEYRFNLEKQEYEKKISDMKRQIEELRIKAEQSSSQLRGEVLERSLEIILKDIFKNDEIEPVKTGAQGADILHRVYNNRGMYCGTIVWEAKRAKNWQDKWLKKLREDQQKEGAEIAVLVSEVLPSDVNGIGIKERIVITSYENVVPIAILLRNQLIEIAKIKSIHDNKETKAKLIYDYLSSTKFKHRMETAIDVYNQMIEDLRQEKQTMQKLWSKREKQLEIALQNLASLYGELQAIAGTSLADVKSLNFPDVEPED